MVIDELVFFSNLYGSNEDLVLAGGGNTSAKDGDIMYIKGSGTSLSTIKADGFVKMNRERLAKIFTKKYPDDDKLREELSLKDLMDAREEGQENKRPSVETTLHSLFKETFVLHLHPSLINGLTCGKDGERICKKLFGNKVLWVEPTKPGYILAKTCYDAMENYKKENGDTPDILLLANHGIFVAGNTVENLGNKLYFVMDKIRGELKLEPDTSVGDFDGEKAQETFNELYRIFGDECVVTYEPSQLSLNFSKNAQSFKKIEKPFNPDQIVYCKPYPIYAESKEEIEKKVKSYKAENGFLPKIIFVKDCGLYAVDFNQKGSETAAALMLDGMKIAVYSESFGGVRPMTTELIDFIVNWEAESYRSKQN